MKNLQLPLKREWFELTESGEKPEDYREITPYWCVRLFEMYGHSVMYEDYRWEDLCDALNNPYEDVNYIMKIDSIRFKPFNQNTMTLGYPKSNDTGRILKFENAGIEIRTGNPAWGAEPNKRYFVIKHGKRL